MNRLLLVLLLSSLVFGCATSPPEKVERSFPTVYVSPTAEDMFRTYPATLGTIVAAGKLALADIGADYFEPHIELNGDDAVITAGTKTCLYGIILLAYPEYTEVMLVFDNKSNEEAISKSMFDEFWAALESHL